MGTNYYFINKVNRKEVEDSNKKIDNALDTFAKTLEEVGYKNYEFAIENLKWKFEIDEKAIHIGKRSSGWKPLFESCEHFSSMEELKQWWKDNQDRYLIENEYRVELTWKELENELIKWNGERSHTSEKYSRVSVDQDGFEWLEGDFD